MIYPEVSNAKQQELLNSESISGGRVIYLYQIAHGVLNISS